jgi:hypothetical protein
MNKFNDVFLAAKEYYEQCPSISHECDFEKVANAAGVPPAELDFYLNILQQMGLIKYSITEDKYLFLTGYGVKTKTLLTDEFKV